MILVCYASIVTTSLVAQGRLVINNACEIKTEAACQRPQTHPGARTYDVFIDDDVNLRVVQLLEQQSVQR